MVIKWCLQLTTCLGSIFKRIATQYNLIDPGWILTKKITATECARKSLESSRWLYFSIINLYLYIVIQKLTSLSRWGSRFVCILISCCPWEVHIFCRMVNKGGTDNSFDLKLWPAKQIYMYFKYRNWNFNCTTLNNFTVYNCLEVSDFRSISVFSSCPFSFKHECNRDTCITVIKFV